MEQMMIAGIGELLWDVLGDVEKLGGAPVNFTFYINSLGAKGIPISTIGDDAVDNEHLMSLQAVEFSRMVLVLIHCTQLGM